LPHAARVEQDHVSLGDLVRQRKPVTAQSAHDELAVEHVHLAAKGLEIELAGHGASAITRLDNGGTPSILPNVPPIREAQPPRVRLSVAASGSKIHATREPAKGNRMSAPKFDLQGHRGARGLKPENTLPSFEAAIDAGATTIETDLHRTRDGVPVLVHD